ncbi:MAG TPA: PQQ-binding-like beta-propeller repeat protein [Blastocatellia bacterium]|nr:PQQ-binding-like beta-propeller repeat protein [Blastocatellia bacterium]
MMRLLSLLFGFFISTSPLALPSDWPQWRGPNRDGLADFRPPKAWPDKLTLKWKITVGEGHSSPVVAGNRVYTHTRVSDNETVSCFDLATGKQLWQQAYAAPYQMHPAAVGHGKGPKSTPVIAAGKVYTLGISGILSCFDAVSGRVLWRKDFSSQFKTTSPLFGTAMSPLVDSGLLIAHAGGHDSGALTAFDAATGQVKWRWNGDGPGYASPIIVAIDGGRQVVTQTQENIVGVSFATGELLWRVPFTTEYTQNVVTPVEVKGLLIFSGINNGTMALKLSKQGNKWSHEQVWLNQDVSMYMNSPVARGNLLFGMSHKRKGQFFCLEAASGKTLWTSEGRDGDNAAIICGGDVLLLLSTDATLTIARASGEGFQPVKKYTVADSPTWAHPAITSAGLLIKDAKTLALWGF